MKLTIFPRKISNTYLGIESSRGGSKLISTINAKGSNINTSKYNENNKLVDYKKMARVLSLDKQLFKTARLL